MDRSTVEALILCLASDMLLGKATKEKIERVTQLAKENNCMDILAREFKSVSKTLEGF